MDYLSSLPYPGNIRELKNLVERTLLVSPATHLDARDFRAQYTGLPLSPSIGTQESSTLESKERIAIENALAQSGGNLTRTAALLGISRQALYRRIEKYGITL